MAVIRLILIAFLITQVSCEKNSLAFVIDDTLSLYEDIKQVKDASHSIIDLILKERPGEIEDYLLVTFNHKDVAFRKKTRDPKELTQAIDAIKVHSNDKSCSEKALSGVTQALKESRNGSLLYVFTDASASDYSQFEDVKTLCETKKSQIFFIVSGHCGDISSRRYQVYHDIAAACKGQAITIDKADITEVPKYFKEIIDGKSTVIESIVAPANKWGVFDFELNSFIEDPIIIASGIDVNLTIVNKINKAVKRGERITWTKNFKAYKLTRKRTGVYTVQVKGLSPVNAAVLARTKFSFQFGFSINKESSLDAVYPQPFTDIKTHLLIFVKDPEASAEVQGVELHDTHGNVSKPLVLVKDNVYATDKFNSSDKPFKIKVVAKAKKTGRIAKPSVKSLVEPMQPTSVELLQIKSGESIDLHCRIPGNKTKSQIKWYTKKSEAEDFSIISDQAKELLRVVKAKTNDHYKCVALTTEGYEQYNGKLDIQVRPQFYYPPALITQNEGKPVTIECKIFEGSPRPDIAWQFKHVNDKNFTIIKDHQGETLNLTEVTLKDAGDYQCIANNTQGTDVKSTRLLVTVVPEIFKRDSKFTIKEGTSVDLLCRILKGTPKPVITWYSKRQDMDDYEEIIEEAYDVYHVNNAKISKHYKCVANNSAGTDEHIIHVAVQASPEFMDKRTSITVIEGKPVTINCKLSKGSEPLVKSWESKLKKAAAFEVMKHGGDELHFPAADLSHAKVYKCVAENPEGRAEKITELIIQAVPVIGYLTPNKTALEKETVILECRIKKGSPAPTITWLYKGPDKTEFVNISKSSEVISLVNVQAKDAGQYRCVAENDAGRAEQTLQLVVHGPPQIVFNSPNSPHIFAVEGDAVVRLPCDAVGYPAPNITWLVDDKSVGLDKCKLPVVKGFCNAAFKRWYYDSDLNICRDFSYGGCGGNPNRFDTEAACISECVKPPPPIDICKLPKKKGLCLSAIPKWYYDNTLKQCLQFNYGGCFGNANQFNSKAECEATCPADPSTSTLRQELIVDGNALIIQHPKKGDSSKYHSYVCRATNGVGSDSQTYDVVVSAAPVIEYLTPNKTALEKETVILECRIKKGLPVPTITWLYKGPDKTEFVNISKSSEVISLVNVQAKDAGQYRCVVENDAGRAEQTLQLVVHGPPQIVFNSPNSPHIFAVEGDAVVRLPCDAVGYPAPTITWLVDDKSVGLDKCKLPVVKGLCNAAFKRWYYDSDLNICRDFSYGGCGGNPNRFDTEAACISECVKPPPPIDICKLPKKKGLCLSAIPKWYYDNTLKQCLQFNYGGCFGNANQFSSKAECEATCPADPSTSTLRQELIVDGNALIIQHPKKGDSSKYHSYVCRATNGVGSDSQTYDVVVSAAPVIEYLTPNKTALEKETVILECRIKKGLPVPTITWLYKSPDKTEFVNISKSSEVISLVNVQAKDAGQYRCVVENDAGRAEQTLQLVVHGPPQIVFNSPNSPHIFAVEGDAVVRLPCDAVGYPAPTITWLVDDKSVGLDKCKLPVVKGLCNAAFKRWYYDSDLNICRDFSYGGCGGNPNRFDTEAACISECVKPPPPIDICKLPKKKGLCLSAIPKWYYDNTLKQCLQFNYGGCFGNANQFSSKAECEATCPADPSTSTLRQELIVDGNALIIQHPKKGDSSKYHSYVCRATNGVGSDSQTYDVVVSDHIEFGIQNETYGLFNMPYDIKCALPFADSSSSSVKWYKNSIVLQDQTGPVLHFDNPSDLDNGNYTCRVTDLTHSASHTVQVKFGLPPSRTQTLYNVEWNGGTKEIDCYSSQYPAGTYKWSYNGKQTDWNKRYLSINNWGEYTCIVTNPLGSLKVIFKVKAPNKACRVHKSLFTSENAPLVLDSSSSWPMLSTVGDYYIVPKSEKLQLICQDKSDLNSNNGFTKFPNLRFVNVTCYEEDSFQFGGFSWKISDFVCQKKVKASTKRTRLSCLGENTEWVQVGFFVNNFTEVYRSCVDLRNSDLLYTKMNTIPLENIEILDNTVREKSCVDDTKCCYESIKLVNEVDVSFGPARNAGFLNNDFNSVNYCKMKNDIDWENVEMISRSDIPYTVWTGVAQYRVVSGKKVPKYLWKILRYYTGSEVETIVIIHENVERPGPRLCEGVCGKKIVLFEPAGHRTYCCSLEDLRHKLNVKIELDEY